MSPLCTGRVMRQELVGAVVGEKWGNRVQFEAVHLDSGGKDEVGHSVVGQRGC